MKILKNEGIRRVRFLTYTLSLFFGLAIFSVNSLATTPDEGTLFISGSGPALMKRRSGSIHANKAKLGTNGSNSTRKSNKPYDYIVVGAGSSGCALVFYLLSKDPNISVLLIEAGASNDLPEVHDYTKAMDLHTHPYDNCDTSSPQGNMMNRKMPYDSGNICGGTSSINGMVWFRGNPADYDSWAESTGDEAWSYNSVLPLFKWLETYGDGDPEYRGKSGEIYVTDKISQNEVSKDFVKAMEGMGYSFNQDYNGEKQRGVVYTQLNVRQDYNGFEGYRQDAYTTLLAPYLKSKNLDLILKASVDKVLFDENKKAKGVSIWQGSQNSPLTANKGVVLCAGTLRTPAILMRSGIGDPKDLKPLGIRPFVELGAVGKNLQDQIITFGVWKLRQEDPNHSSVMDNNIICDGLPQDNLDTGPPRFQIQTFYMKKNPGFPEKCFAIGAIQLHPKARGYVKISSSDPEEKLLIDPNLLPGDDISEVLKGLKTALKIGDQFQSWLGDRIMPKPSVISDGELINYIKSNAVTDYHFIGTARMGKSSEDSVVNPLLEVFGVKDLWVADNSVMPTLTSGNTNVPAMMIGAQCAKFILKKNH